MSFIKLKLAPWYGIGVFLAPAPSVADPSAMYKYTLSVMFWKWSWYFHFGRL